MKFKKPQKHLINYACIMTTGRTGSDYLQGCLDGVPGVITFSGELPFFKFIENKKTIEILKKKNSKKLIDHFINLNKNLFYYDKLENKKFNFSIKKFKAFFTIIIKEKKFNKKNFLNSLYLSYHLTINRKILKKNIIIHHSHNVLETEKFMRYFKN